MKKYFRLHPYVKAVDGDKKCSVYNILNGDVFAISKIEYEILKKCEQNVALDEIKDIDYKFISNLKSNGLGLTYNKPVYINEDFYGIPHTLSDVFDSVTLNSLFIELTNKCNLNCKFCKCDNVLYRKTGCKKWPSEKGPLSVEEWKDLISQAKNLRCRNFIIIGGEPLLEFEKLKEIVKYIKSGNMPDTKITIYTNGVLLDDEKIDFIKQHNISICMQLLSDNNQTYQVITGEKGVFDIISKNIYALKKSNIPYSLLFLINRFNESEAASVLEKFKDSVIKIEYIYPIDNDFYSNKYIKQMYDRSKDFIKLSLPMFDKMSKYNVCYQGTLAISCDGSTYPCIMSRKLYLGNIHDLSLKDILYKNETIEYSNLSKCKIEGCSSCHKRYGCLDCRALEMSATNNLYGMKFCNILEET